MTTQLLAWTATVVGLLSTWLCGRRHTSGWAYGIACCGLWTAVNVRLHVWAGVVSALVAGGLAGWNWWRWSRLPLEPVHEQQPRHVRHGPPLTLGEPSERFERLGFEPDLERR